MIKNGIPPPSRHAPHNKSLVCFSSVIVDQFGALEMGIFSDKVKTVGNV